MEASNLKMYIAVREEVPAHMVPVCVAHAVLTAHDNFYSWEEYREWYQHSFKKVVVSVNQKEWNKIQQLDGVYLGHENSTLGGEKCVAVIRPMLDTPPNVLKFAKMWKP